MQREQLFVWDKACSREGSSVPAEHAKRRGCAIPIREIRVICGCFEKNWLSKAEKWLNNLGCEHRGVTRIAE